MKTFDEDFAEFIQIYEARYGSCPPPVVPVLRDFFAAGAVCSFLSYEKIMKTPSPVQETDDELLARVNAEVARLAEQVLGYAKRKTEESLQRRAAEKN